MRKDILQVGYVPLFLCGLSEESSCWMDGWGGAPLSRRWMAEIYIYKGREGKDADVCGWCRKYRLLATTLSGRYRRVIT